MRYGSLFSGIEAATVAWEPLGWKPSWFSEIEPFPSAVLSHHYPDIPNKGDVTNATYEPVDLLVGGSPCQSFSVAGKRLGLDDPRGNLALVYLSIVDRLRPRWFVYENVPGLLSSGGGRDFGAFLGTVGELGYGWAYRVLDAQYFGVPQRRRRVFVVGHSANWTYPAAVLFERAGLRGDSPPSREEGTGVAALTADGVGTCGANDNQAQTGHLIAFNHQSGGDFRPMPQADIANPLQSNQGQSIAYGGNNTTGMIDVATAVNARGGTGRMDFESETFVLAPPITSNPYGDHKSREGLLATHSLTARYDSSPDGSGRGTPVVAVFAQNQEGEVRTSNVVGTLNQNSNASGRNTPMVALTCSDRGISPDQACGGMVQPTEYGVRRLTPRECERLQGFPDDYTLIPYRGKPARDGPRYKALGNSMAVPVIRWIGERIMAVENLNNHFNSVA